MEYFCSDQLWDQNLTWGNHRPYPMFTECFQDMVLGTVPSLWLLVTFPIYLYILSKTKDHVMSRSWLYQAKMGLVIVQISIRCNDLLNVFTDVNEAGKDVNMSHYAAECLELVALLVTLVLIELERKRNYVTSAVLTIYWTLATVCGMIVFYCKIMEPKEGVSLVDAVTCQSVLACSILQFILICFPDPSFILPGERQPAIARASFVSRVLYLWAQKSLVCGYTRNLEDDDFDKLADENTCATAGSNLIQNWERENKRNQEARHTSNNVSLFRVLCRTYACDLICSNCLRVMDLFAPVCRYIIVGYLIEFADDVSQPTWKAFVYMAGILLLNLVEPINFNYICLQCACQAMRMRSALCSMVFEKSVKMTNRSRAEKTVGDMTNLLNQDVNHIKHWIAWIWVVWSVPLEFILNTVLLYSVVGYGVFAALLVLLLTLPLNTYAAKRGIAFYKERVNFKDERIELLTELLNGIKILKFYAWELAFGDKVLQIRDKEMKILMKEKLLGIIMCMVFGIAPFFMAFAALATFVYFDDNHMLTARTAFMALSIFGGFSGTFSSLPHIWSHFTTALISMKRLDEFFNKDDIDPDDITHATSENAVSISGGRFTWDPKIGVCLNEIQVDIPKGSLVAIVGKIGCGKSSMLSAILGEMEKNSGSVNIDGSIAYVPQVAWIQNATLKKNILFGEKVRSKIYNDIIEACSLGKDLEILPEGDQTEIGEKGVNLSGGQKQRVSLARAVYSNADIYLLDDPLSAVDAHVGKHIFEQVIGTSGLLRNKTRVLVTHGTTWLPYVDTVIVMDNGQITEQGHYNELMNNEGNFARFIKEYSLNKNDGKLSSDDEMTSTPSMTDSGYVSVNYISDTDENTKGYGGRIISTINEKDDLPILNNRGRKPMLVVKRSISRAISHEDGCAFSDTIFTHVGDIDQHGVIDFTEETSATAGKQMDEDEIEFGNLKLRHLKTYLLAIGPWYCVVGISVFIMSRVVGLIGDYNIRNWTSDAELQNLTSISGDSEYRQHQNTHYIKIHATIGIIKLVCVSFVRLIFALRVAKAADILHRKLLNNVLRGPMSFFDRTPVGRIVNRFSGDLEPLDGQLYEEGLGIIDNVLHFLQVLFVITFTLPEFLVILPPLGIAYYFIQKYFVPTRRQLSRMRSKRTTPIISHFSETLNGTSVIRAFSKQQQFMREFANKVDHDLELDFMDNAIERWLDVRLHFLSAAFVSGTVLIAVWNRNILTGAMLGLVLRTAELLSGCMHGFVRRYGQIQKQIVCLEKVDEYTTKKTEAATHTSVKPSDIWPAKGEITVRDFSLRYKEGLPLILKGIDMSVHPGEKIGIVGRTGAGKSSLTLGLFRLIEATEGSITIDDHDISELGLFDLRSQLTILPQDPVLFSGTLKDNLDPHGNHSDAIIYDALQHAHLKPFVESLPEKLDYQCGEGGQNLSVGQRQLICLARSLLRKSKVLVLDEATSAVDMATDELIQTTLKEEFKDCTVLTIAHRLNTIIDYDRILVLDRGLVEQFDTPETLLADHEGIFYGMAKDAGLV